MLRRSEDVRRLQSRTAQNRARKQHHVNDKTAENTQKELDIVLTFHDKLKRLPLNQRTVARREEKSRRHWTVQLRVVYVVSVHTQKKTACCGVSVLAAVHSRCEISTEHNF